MIENNCLLCHNAKCTQACGIMDPAKILRSLYFDNEAVVANNLEDDLACNYCDERCKEACPIHVNIRDLILNVPKPEKKYEITYDCLKSEFCGIPLENPFLLSSSVIASKYDMCARAFEAGWGGAAFKTICLMEIVEASPRFSAIKGDHERIIGFKNIEQLSENTLDENMQIFRKLKDNYPDKFLLVSFMGRNDEEWAYLAEKLNDSGADALELNFSCPNMTEGHTGSDVGQIPELVERYCRIVKQHTRLPFIAKLTPNVTDIRESADAAIRGGADGVAAINTIKSLIEIGAIPEKQKLYVSIGGYSGKAVKPIALRFIAELAKDENVKDKHISAMGGIETWKDAMEFIVLGADTVQVTTAVMQYGYRIIEDIKDGVALSLISHDIKNIEELERKVIDNVVPTESLDRSYIIYPKFIHDKCVGCQRCYVSCMDGGHQAISIVDGKPRLDPNKCVGCHLCVLVCPQNAIESSEIKVPKSKIYAMKGDTK